MPGTIHVSILELVGHPSVQQSSSMGIKVSMGKQVYDMQEKGDFSFILASLRDNLSVTIHDSEGNEIAHTGVESRSIVEKGMWDDKFPLQGGGHVHMRLHFILTEEEQKKIRSMLIQCLRHLHYGPSGNSLSGRESAARKKQEDLLKRSHSISDLAVASGGSSALRGDSLKSADQAQDRIVDLASRQPNTISSSSTAKAPSQVDPDQKKQTFLTSKSTGALDKLPGYQRVKKQIQHQKEEQQSRLDRTPSSALRARYQNSVLHKQDASPGTNITRAMQVSSITMTDIPVKAPRKTVPMRDKPILSKLVTVPAPISEENATERVESMADIPLKSPEKMVSVNAKPDLSNLEIIHAPSSKEIVSERADIGDTVDSCQETSCSTTTIDTPLKAPKNTISESAKPILSNLETLPTTISEDIVAEGAEIGDFVDACQESIVQNTEQFKEVGIQSIEQMSNEKKISQMQPVNEVSKEETIAPNKLLSKLVISGQSMCSWKTLSQRLPQNAKKQISTSVNSSVFEKTWRSKHPKSCGHNMKSKVSCVNTYYSSGSFRGWIFLDEIIPSCVRSDDRPLIDLLEDGCSNCSRDTIQEKVEDTEIVSSKDEKDSVDLRALSSGERPDGRPNIRPFRQALNIAIMAGFGILVFLSRQRK